MAKKAKEVFVEFRHQKDALKYLNSLPKSSRVKLHSILQGNDPKIDKLNFCLSCPAIGPKTADWLMQYTDLIRFDADMKATPGSLYNGRILSGIISGLLALESDNNDKTLNALESVRLQVNKILELIDELEESTTKDVAIKYFKEYAASL